MTVYSEFSLTESYISKQSVQAALLNFDEVVDNIFLDNEKAKKKLILGFDWPLYADMGLFIKTIDNHLFFSYEASEKRALWVSGVCPAINKTLFHKKLNEFLNYLLSYLNTKKISILKFEDSMDFYGFMGKERRKRAQNMSTNIYEDSEKEYNSKVQKLIKDFYLKNEHADENSIINFIDNFTYLGVQESDIPIKKLTLEDVIDSYQIQEAKSVVKKNNLEYEKWKALCNRNALADATKILMIDFVKNEFPNRKMTDGQAVRLIQKAYTDGHNEGMKNVLACLADDIYLLLELQY